jgi:hypothetical protein
MYEFDRRKYILSVFEGDEPSGKLTEVQVRRVDGDEIGAGEVEDLLLEFESIFPKDLYKIGHETKVQEDDRILHAYINLTKEERLRRTKGALGQRVIVPKTEVEKRLKDW